NSKSASDLESVIDTASIVLMKERVSQTILDSYPGPRTAAPQAITQHRGPSRGHIVKRIESRPHLFAQFGGKVQAKIARELKTISGLKIALPGPIIFHIRATVRIGKVAVVDSAGFGVEAQIRSRETDCHRDQHSQSSYAHRFHDLILPISCLANGKCKLSWHCRSTCKKTKEC